MGLLNAFLSCLRDDILPETAITRGRLVSWRLKNKHKRTGNSNWTRKNSYGRKLWDTTYCITSDEYEFTFSIFLTMYEDFDMSLHCLDITCLFTIFSGGLSNVLIRKRSHLADGGGGKFLRTFTPFSSLLLLTHTIAPFPFLTVACPCYQGTVYPH